MGRDGDFPGDSECDLLDGDTPVAVALGHDPERSFWDGGGPGRFRGPATLTGLTNNRLDWELLG
jgi:hypothetical protein